MSYLDVLDAREQRKHQIDSFLTKYPGNTVISVKANIPGPDKNINEANVIVNLFSRVLHETYAQIIYHKTFSSADGPYVLFVIDENGIKAKKKCVNIEDKHPLGRLVDMDVFHDNYLNNLTRSNLDLSPRKCFLCDGYAHECSRSQKHTLSELLSHLEKITHQFIVESITKLAVDAMHSELATYPKCGLVSDVNNGVHSDMDSNTFRVSIQTLRPFIKKYALLGFKKNPFSALREVGKKAEIELLASTNGINTLKGANFLLGFTVPSLVNAVYNNKSFDEVKNYIKVVCKDLTKNDFKNLESKEELTYGEKIYLKYRLKGIRGEVEKGLPSIFNQGMKAYQEAHELNENDQNIHTLITLMSTTDDTTLLHDCDINVLKEVKQTFTEIKNMGGYLTQEGKHKYLEVHHDYLKRGISPGGSADLLIITILIYKSLEMFHLIES